MNMCQGYRYLTTKKKLEIIALYCQYCAENFRSRIFTIT